MRKSFRWHLFVRILIAVTVIIYSNRLLASYLTTASLNNRVHENIAFSLLQCKDLNADESAFLLCLMQAGKRDVIVSLAEYLVPCAQGFQSAENQTGGACGSIMRIDGKADRDQKTLDGSVQMSRVTLNEVQWLRFSDRNDPATPTILIRQIDIDHFVNSIWNLRDRILIYVLPVVLTMLLLLTFYMTYVILRPVRLIEESLTTLSSHNLDRPLDLLPPYREFERFILVFEQLRQRLNKGLLQARRFAADASHELRTPLTILRGNSERLIASVPTGSDVQVRMRLMGDEIERLIEITEKLLLLSRADANSIKTDMEPVSLSDLLSHFAADDTAFNTELKIETKIEPNIVFLCDRGLIQQLIYNLYSNAEKYNIEQGWIRLKLSRTEKHFTLSIENPCDSIPPDFHEKAFERFYRGDSARGRKVDGVGLGLALCMEIARLHNASLEIRGTAQRTVVATLQGRL